MRNIRKFNLAATLAGLAMLFFGVNVLYRGVIWNLVLAEERYFVGGIVIAFGLYILFLVYKTRLDQ
jgi:hypothetical protein